MRSAVALASGWLLPGGAYLLRRRYAQFALTLLLVCLSLSAGIRLRGSNRWPVHAELQGLDGFTTATARVGALTKILAGAPYIIATLFGYSQPFITGQVHEYGTTLLVAAGLINVIALAEAK